MLKVKFYDSVDDELLKFAVIISQSNGKWVLCKHKERDTYEVPGGHREVGEDILETAERELQEETGAVKFDIKPLCVYSVTEKNSVNERGEESFGLLCFAEIEEFSGKLESEIERVELMDELPENWTYPLIQPKLIEEWKRRQPWSDIAQSKEWKKIHKITKGWSTDLKYKIDTKKGEVLLLRLADIEKYDEKKKEFDIITKYSKLGIPMSMPVEFGVCNQNRNVYIILTWVEGQDLETVLPYLSENEQYALGRLAGNILKKIHSIPVEESDIPAKTKVDKKILQLSRYESSKVRVANDEIAVKYVKDNIQKIWKEKPVYQHGDFHPGNLIYMEYGEIGVIDFNRWEVGDPYEEFYKLESFARELSVPYCIGQIQSYFDDEVPEVFWNVLAVYVAHASLYSIKWAEKFGQSEIDGMVERCMAAFKDYDYFRRNIPVWYEEKELVNMENMIREANKKDLDEILQLYLYLHEKSIPDDTEHLRNTWDSIINDKNHHLIVCEVDGKLVASCVCVIIPNLTRNVRPYAFVENVVTHRDYRKKGYATACLNFAKQIAEENHCYKMMLLTGSKEESTLNFYRNAGYNSSDKTAFIQWIDM